jgi:hypothetical protein
MYRLVTLTATLAFFFPATVSAIYGSCDFTQDDKPSAFDSKSCVQDIPTSSSCAERSVVAGSSPVVS